MPTCESIETTLIESIFTLNENVLPVLTSWQREFVDAFAVSKERINLLVAPNGTGKTTVALTAASAMLAGGVVDFLLVISPTRTSCSLWSSIASRLGLDLETSMERWPGRSGVATTVYALSTDIITTKFKEAGRAKRWLIIADDLPQHTKPVVDVVDLMLSFNLASRALYTSYVMPQELSFDAVFRFGSELIFDRAILQSPDTETRIAQFSPSFSLLRQLHGGGVCYR